MLKIGIIVGSTRPNRNSIGVAKWVYDIASKRQDAEFEIIDLAEINLPIFDEGIPPSMHQYEHEYTKKWAEIIDSLDGYIFVTPEYNHSIPGVLKNALDFIYREWNNKAAGFVSYGSMGGVRAVEQLRLIMAELQVADVRTNVALSLFTDFEHFSVFKPAPIQEKTLNVMLDQLINWSNALKPLREKK